MYPLFTLLDAVILKISLNEDCFTHHHKNRLQVTDFESLRIRGRRQSGESSGLVSVFISSTAAPRLHVALKTDWGSSMLLCTSFLYNLRPLTADTQPPYFMDDKYWVLTTNRSPSISTRGQGFQWQRSPGYHGCSSRFHCRATPPDHCRWPFCWEKKKEQM